MKPIINIMLLPFLFWAACNDPQKVPKDEIAGTYINHAQSAYSIADDTIEVVPDVLTGNSYQVIRKTGFRRLPNGKPEHKLKTFTGIWDGKQQAVTITQNGLLLLFGHNELKIGNTQYQKL
jgi:hypothetical protein